MKLSDYIVEFLIEKGCTCVFGYQGGAVTHLVDSLYKYKNIKYINTYHEQGAAFAAEGYARTKNNIGVAVATSGPGATNLITGIGSAYFDSIPCIYLTGQVNTYEYKDDMPVRQVGFQETDIVSIVKPITKYAVRITEPCSIRYELEKAVYIATSGRKGPVLLDIPMDIQRADISEQNLQQFVPHDDFTPHFDIEPVIKHINNALRPVILAGGGVRLSGGSKLLNEITDSLKIPVVCSLMGKDAADNNSEYHIGMIGTYGNRAANFAVANSDLVIAVGTRLDTRQTGTVPESFAREAVLIRVDIDEGELSKKIKADEYPIRADVKAFLRELWNNTEHINAYREEWVKKVKEYKAKYPTYTNENYSDPNYIMEKLSQMMNPEDIICLDVGQNQMWGAQSIYAGKEQRILTSGGMGAMGFSLPCAIGAYYAGNNRPVTAFTGDGGIQMNIQELELVRRNNIPVKIIIMNNNSLGMIRHFQEMYFDCRYNATVIDYAAPDFCRIADAYGIRNIRIKEEKDYEALTEILHNDEPVLIDIDLPCHTYAYPKLEVNKPVEEQEPMIDREEFLKNMIIKPYNGNSVFKGGK